MAIGGGIDLGDAVFSFLADTTSLDTAITKVNSEITSSPRCYRSGGYKLR